MFSMNSKGSVEKFYDNFANNQIQMGVNHRHLAIQRRLEEKGLKKNARILEIGAGIGTQTELMLLYLKSEGYVVANDISNDSLNIAEASLNKYTNVKFLHGNIIDIEIKDSFDCIVLPDVLEHIPKVDHNRLFGKLSKLIKDDGFIFIHIPNPDYLNWVRDNYPDQLQIIDQSLSTQ